MKIKSLSTEAIIQRATFKCPKKMAKNIVCMFFKEAKESIKQGKEVRLPGNKNGTLSLVIKSREVNSHRVMKYIGTGDNVKSILQGTVRPRLINFDIRNAAPHCLVKEFKIKYSYPKQFMKELAKFDDKQRSLLMAID